jgi:hypothetical protein
MSEHDQASETERYWRDGYVPLRALFPREVLDAFYMQMRGDLEAAGRPLQSFVAEGPLLRGRAIELYAYQYAPMLTFLWGLTPRMSAATGRDLLPTYAYFRAYQRGDICRVHYDRPSCEHSLSLTIAYAEDKPWALSVATDAGDGPNGNVTEDFGSKAYGSVEMAPGDAVLYQGTHRLHGRLEPNPNSWSAHLFLHWIERGGQYAEHAFDRPAIERATRGRPGQP